MAAGSAPIVLGHPVDEPDTIATAIRIGNPASWQQAEAARDESGGRIEAVTDEEILAAHRILSARGLDAIARDLRTAETNMASEDDAVREKAMKRYTRLDAEFTAAGGYASESEASSIASSLALDERILTQPLRTLSGGQRRRVELARILFSDADTMLLDEPTTYLDPAHAIDMLGLVKKVAREGRTVVMVLHDLMLAGMFSDRMVMMRDGAVKCDGSPAEVLTPANLEAVYGLDAEIIDDPQGGCPIIVPRGSFNGRVAAGGC